MQELEDPLERIQERIGLVKERTPRDSSPDSDYQRHRDRSSRPGACPTDDSEDKDWRPEVKTWNPTWKSRVPL